MRDSSRTICSRCISDLTLPDMRFDEQGVCQYCALQDRLEGAFASMGSSEQQLQRLIEAVKASGTGKRYDCIVGLSGGTDSSYTLHKVIELGLRPLAVHFDNGWNTDQAVSNIKSLTDALGVELYTYVVDWEEFRSLQIAFLKASVPCIEAPTDVAIHAVLYKLAVDEGIKFILGGQSFRSEGTVPRAWSYLDGTYVNSVRKFAGLPRFRSYPNLTLPMIFYYTFLRGVKQIPFLNLFDYRKADAKALLANTYGWRDYSGHHYENIYSRFAFGWYLPKKFGIDKRKVSYSGAVRSGHMSREDALAAMSHPPDVDDRLVDFVIRKLRLSREEFEKMMQLPKRTYRDFFTSEDILKHLKGPVSWAVKAGYFTPVLYEKYFGD